MLLSPLRMRSLLFRGFATPVSRFSGRKNCNLGRRGIADLPCAQDYGARAARNTEVLVRGTHTFMYRAVEEDLQFQYGLSIWQLRVVSFLSNLY